MKNILFSLLLSFTVFSCKSDSSNSSTSAGSASYEFWLSNPDQSALFQKQTARESITGGDTAPVIEVYDDQTRQPIDGFGFSLTGGSAMLLHQMSAPARSAILTELFSTDGNNIGVSVLRISIGSSDLDDRVFSYNDLPSGQTDTALSQFSIDPDRAHLIPVLKEILAINPDIMILGSPWSAPAWMKTNNSSIGGNLKPQYYGVYARYFVKYIQAMKNEGITINAITIQNEPLHGGNNPSMVMEAVDQANFIKNYLGPAFAANAITARIIIYDHNADRTDYPLTILSDPDARKYVDGSAFHLYGGSINDLSTVFYAHPDKNLYFTEQWIGAPGNFSGDLRWHTGTLIIGGTRNWCRTVLEWNLAADPNLDPHTPGGCTQCLGALTISNDNVVRNPAYYIIAHASKFVRPGSVRIESTIPGSLVNVAFRRADGKKVLIVLNDSQIAQLFTINNNGTKIVTYLNAGAVGTYAW